MIFVTVGEQLPFDRLVRTVDEWAANYDEKIFAQTGKSQWKPSHIDYKDFLAPEEYNDKLTSADLVVAHAGMGTIISALELGKPILVMPRQSARGEHRNEHQYATAKRFESLNYLSVAMDEDELIKKLNNYQEIIISKTQVETSLTLPNLIRAITKFVQSE